MRSMLPLALPLPLLTLLVACGDAKVTFPDDTAGVVDPGAALALTPASLDFGTLLPGEAGAQAFLATNTGETTLTLTFAASPEGYALGTTTTSLEPGAETAVTVTFLGVTAGTFAGSVTVTDETGAELGSVALTAVVDGNVDVDGDGVLAQDDCDDTNSAVYPGAEDTWYDGIDSDCAGNNDFDKDGDGRLRAQDGGDDCDDEDATIYTGAADAWYDGIDSDCAGNDDFDQDADGQTSRDTGGPDCDDEDATIYTGAAETWYDGVDQDCAGDDDFDQDADGDPVTGGDCDDTDPSRSSRVVETCDDIDNDCDGSVDEDLPSVTGYPDADGDGYGVDSGAVTDCAIASGYASRSGDCDDGNAGRNPGLTETGYNAQDDDCDLYVDEMDAESETSWTITSSRANDALGTGAMSILDDALDDGNVQVVACSPTIDYSSSVADIGACAFHDSSVRGDPATFTAGDFELYGDSGGNDAFGAGIELLGDVDGDGYTDLVYSSYTDNRDDSSTNASGSVYFGSLSLGIDYRYSSMNAGSSSLAYYSYRSSWQRVVEGTSSNGYLGYDLSIGDFDGDGETDVAAGAPGEESAKGRAWVFLFDDYTELDGGDREFRRTTTGDASYSVVGMSANDHLGYSILLADVNNDGYDDMIACAPDDDDGGAESGSCWVDLGRSSVSVSSQTVQSQADGYVFGTAPGDQLGKTRHSLAAGDFDGDGAVELGIGVPGHDGGGTDGGAVAIWSNGSFSGAETLSGAAWLVLGDGGLGTALALPGDVDGDGTGDLLAGAPSAAGAGRVYLLSGGAAAGSWSLPGSQDASWQGAASGDLFGSSISNLTDADGDGREDFVVGAPGSDTSASNAGKAYVLPAYP
jgi:hypothetical protein